MKITGIKESYRDEQKQILIVRAEQNGKSGDAAWVQYGDVDPNEPGVGMVVGENPNNPPLTDDEKNMIGIAANCYLGMVKNPNSLSEADRLRILLQLINRA